MWYSQGQMSASDPPPSPPGPAPARPGWNADLLVLAAAVVLFNLPYFRGEFLPAHDSKSVFGLFTYFHSHAAVHHELPLWMTYGTYGFTSAVFQASYLTVSSYLSILGGVALGVHDSLTLFVISTIVEQLLFLLGFYLLSRRLFSDRLTVLIVGISAAATTVWWWQIFFALRIYYALPLALYFLERFRTERRPEHFWLAGLTTVLGGLGAPPYFYPVKAVLLAGMAAVWGRPFWSSLGVLRERSWRNVAAFAALAASCAVLGLTFWHSLSGIRISAHGRDPATGRASLENFLTFGGVSTTQLVDSFLGAIPQFEWGPQRELTHYIGLLPLAALPVALLRCRHPFFLSLVAAAAGLLLLSLGGTFACLIYPLPLMSLYRHIGYLTILSKILLLLAGGFGIEMLLKALSAGLDRDRGFRFGLLAATLTGLWVITDVRIGGERLVQVLGALQRQDFRSSPVVEAGTVLLRAAAYLAAAVVVLWPARFSGRNSRFSGPAARRAVLMAVILDGVLFQCQVVARMPTTFEATSFPAAWFPYRERRDGPIDPSTEARMHDWVVAGARGAEYPIGTCAAFRVDNTNPQLELDGWSSAGVWRLRQARESIRPDPDLGAVLGITAPKLRLVQSAVYADTPEEAERAVSRSRALTRQVVLLGVPADQRFAAASDGEPAGSSVRVDSFSANRLALTVTVGPGAPAWLVYADGYHPGWHAAVNGRSVAVAEADLAFKAVRVEPGTSTVEFEYHDGIHTVAQKVLAFLAVLGGLGALWLFGQALRPLQADGGGA